MRTKELLKEKGLTQQELANKVGASYQPMKQTLNAPSVTIFTLKKIATALNIPMWQLFASLEDIRPAEDKNTITYPNYGKKFKIEE